MHRKIRIINSKSIEPDGENNYVIVHGEDSLNQTGYHSIEYYINYCIEHKRDTLVFRR